MSCGVRSNIEICQGKTYTQVVRWETAPAVYRAISSISQSAQARIVTTQAHGVPDGWRVAVSSVKGMIQINAQNDPPSDSEYHLATVINTTTLDLNAIDASGYAAYTSGGYIRYFTPVDLAGFDARMMIKTKVGGTTLLSMTVANNRITLDNNAKTITLYIAATDTAGFTWRRGVYDLELISPTGVVSQLLYGSVSVTKEVTV